MTTKDAVDLRPEVQWFAEQMELQLRANDHKGGWQGDTYMALLTRLKEETDELYECIKRLGQNAKTK